MFVVTVPCAMKQPFLANDVFECPIIVVDANRVIASNFYFIRLASVYKKSKETRIEMAAYNTAAMEVKHIYYPTLILLRE